MANSIQLQSEAVLHIPFQNYENDFTFIVNSERFDTSTFAADLLSTKISKIHLTEPTLKEFSICTENRGDFNKILNLLNFNVEEITAEDIPFVREIIDTLEIDKIDFDPKQDEELTIDNILGQIKKHQDRGIIYSKQLESEIQFFISHFHELKDQLAREIEECGGIIEESIIERVISDPALELESEEELLELVNKLYAKDAKYSVLYGQVEFANVCAEAMRSFTEIFDFNDMTGSAWKSIVARLEAPVDACAKMSKRGRSGKRFTVEICNKSSEFDGIFNYLQNRGNIRDEVNITCSSVYSGDPFDLLQYGDKQNYFETQSEPNSWICFEFKNHEVIPSGYIIRSYRGKNDYHPKTWKFEGSSDGQSWATLDSQSNNESLKGGSRVCLFPISNKEHEEKPFKYLRIQQTGPTWFNSHHFLMNSIEIYGKVI